MCIVKFVSVALWRTDVSCQMCEIRKVRLVRSSWYKSKQRLYAGSKPRFQKAAWAVYRVQCVWRVSHSGAIPKNDRDPGFLSKVFRTSFVGTDIVFDDNDRFSCEWLHKTCVVCHLLPVCWAATRYRKLTLCTSTESCRARSTAPRCTCGVECKNEDVPA